MKRSSLANHLSNLLFIMRRNSLRTLSNPASLIREYNRIRAHSSVFATVEAMDYSTRDLEKNRELMSKFGGMKNLQIETVNWFVPYFEHIYGGINTILRFAEYFQDKKETKNRLSIYGNPFASTTEIEKKITKLFPKLSSQEIFIMQDYNPEALPEADISIATEWKSAYLVLKFNKTKGKFYFIQDYEPLFHPAGPLYALAEATYRFDFRGITNTPGLYDMYTKNYNGIAEYFIPSVDQKIFYPSETKPQKPSSEKPFNIFFYNRPEVPRNAFELGILALKRIKKKHGKMVTIFTAGSKWEPKNYRLESYFTDLGVLPYEQTASLYRKCDLGIVFMFTKHPSYLPFELMASGCPVLTNSNPATTWFLKDGINCILTEPTITSICEKTELLMNDLELRKNLISNGLKTIHGNSWDDEIEKIYRFISNSTSV